MEILPAKTELPASPFPTNHDPAESSNYRSFRSCLRWEFGFTCAFCLVHETDLTMHGVEGTGLTWIEHLFTKAGHPELETAYSNCVYSCRFCNSSRGRDKVEPVADERSGRLLNPRENAWRDHFEWNGDELIPRDNDADAADTLESYDLNDARKRKMRTRRRKLVEDRLGVINQGGPRINQFLELAGSPKLSSDERRLLLREAKFIREQIQNAYKDLAQYQVIPSDAPDACSCEEGSLTDLPVFLREQIKELEPPTVSDD